jgi:hypothetical protein
MMADVQSIVEWVMSDIVQPWPYQDMSMRIFFKHASLVFIMAATLSALGCSKTINDPYDAPPSTPLKDQPLDQGDYSLKPTLDPSPVAQSLAVHHQATL